MARPSRLLIRFGSPEGCRQLRRSDRRVATRFEELTSPVAPPTTGPTSLRAQRLKPMKRDVSCYAKHGVAPGARLSGPKLPPGAATARRAPLYTIVYAAHLHIRSLTLSMVPGRACAVHYFKPATLVPEKALVASHLFTIEKGGACARMTLRVRRRLANRHAFVVFGTRFGKRKSRRLSGGIARR